MKMYQRWAKISRKMGPVNWNIKLDLVIVAYENNWQYFPWNIVEASKGLPDVLSSNYQKFVTGNE